MWYLYVLRCGNGTLYTGSAHDVARRLTEHQRGRGAAYTRSHLPLELVAAWQYAERGEALRAEHSFKALPREAKLAWIEGRWPYKGGPFAFEVVGEPQRQRFCPYCGGVLETPGETPVCTVCGRAHDSLPGLRVGTLILRQGRVLLVHRALEPGQGLWDVPARGLGTTELPETAARREAQEETGLEVRRLDLLGFYLEDDDLQGKRAPILTVYFVAEAEGEPCAGEIAERCAWFPLAALPETLADAHLGRVLADLEGWWVARRGRSDLPGADGTAIRSQE